MMKKLCEQKLMETKVNSEELSSEINEIKRKKSLEQAAHLPGIRSRFTLLSVRVYEKTLIIDLQ